MKITYSLFISNTEGAEKVPFDKKRTTPYRHRKLQKGGFAKVSNVKGAKTLIKLVEKINSTADSLTYIYKDVLEKMQTVLFCSYDKGVKYEHTMWYDADIILEIIFHTIYVDGTFKVKPNLQMSWTKSQFLTVMVEVNDQVIRF